MSGEVRTERGKADPSLLTYLFYGKTGFGIEGNCIAILFSGFVSNSSLLFQLLVAIFYGLLIGVGNRQVYKSLILYKEAKE